MKTNKKIILKIMLLIAVGVAMPAVTSSPTFTSYAISSGTDNGGPSDNGGQKPVEAPKGGSVVDRIIEAAKSILGGLTSGYDTPDTSKCA